MNSIILDICELKDRYEYPEDQVGWDTCWDLEAIVVILEFAW